MEYVHMDFDVRCPENSAELNRSLTHLCEGSYMYITTTYLPAVSEIISYFSIYLHLNTDTLQTMSI